jgi:predicted Zn-dependent protease
VQKETIIFTTCGFLLGLTLGGLVIGPKIAQSKLAGAAPVSETESAPAATPPMGGSATPPMGAAGGNPMAAVQQQLATLKAAIEKDPKNFDALVQLGDMYMDAAKFPQAIDYLDRALAVHDDANVRTDLGICYKQTGQPASALAEFERAASMAPDQWQPLFNQAIVLNDLHRTDEARVVAAKLQQMKPDDPDVQKLLASRSAKQ